MTRRPDGTVVCAPFPDYEKEVPTTGSSTQRVTFSANGQVMAQRVKSGATVTLYSLHTDHLGSVVAVGNAGGGLVSGSYAAYEPFGAFLVQPTGTNPSVTDRGFTGQKSNNLSPAWLGLVYMNARYYHPQLGRFVSPDTIVPEPGNPQSYNRYSYAHNSPTNLTDPSGYCAGNPDDPDNTDKSCWSRLLYLQGYYRLILSGDWKFDELLDLFIGLRDLEDALGGIVYFLAAFGGTELNREQGIANGPGNMFAQAASPLKITFWDSAFAAEQFETRWLIAHEFGHIWDARNFLTSSYRLEQATGGSSCLGELLTNCPYSPGGRTVSGYAATNRREDWAESFAALIYGGSWSDIASSSMHSGISPEALIVDPTRIIAVTTEVIAFQRRVQFFEPFSDTFKWGYLGVGGW